MSESSLISTDTRFLSAALAALDWTQLQPNSPITCRVGCAEMAVICLGWRVRCCRRHHCGCESALTDAKSSRIHPYSASLTRLRSAADCALLPTLSSMTASWIAFWWRKWGVYG